MEYLEAAIDLKHLIEQANTMLLEKNHSFLKNKNLMFLKENVTDLNTIQMDEFSNEFVYSTLHQNKQAKAFVMTDLSAMMVKTQKMTYYLYKGYHKLIEKGLVFYQVINENTLDPIGGLQFSNLEKNIFYEVKAPDFEESSSNAMEPEKQIEGEKSIVFFIGNLNEERLVYDIQRLIFDTVNNLQKHKRLKFHFIINISKFNGKPSPELFQQVDAIKTFTNTRLKSEYPNSDFVFEFGD